MNKLFIVSIFISVALLSACDKKETTSTKSNHVTSADAQHGDIGVDESSQANATTTHPDAQWFPEAGLGLFIHWGLSSVNEMSLSWPMRPGRALAKDKITDQNEIARIIREKDYNLTGSPSITPNEYWKMIDGFTAGKYNPEKWMKAAHEAGFKYVVLTTKHHEGFALWPSEFGDFNTKNHLKGRDLVGEYVAAAKKYNLKVGLYFSGGDWWAEKQYKDFMYYKVPRVNPQFPALDADLNPRPEIEVNKQELADYHNELRRLVKGQITELLTRYGRIDVLWFDGSPKVPNPTETMTIAEIRALQPGIVINPRFHGQGDFKTHERHIKTDKPETGWAEFCDTWGNSWSYTTAPFKSNGHVFANYAKARAFNMNYLLGVGPDANGELTAQSYANMKTLKRWHDINLQAVAGNTTPLPENEQASVIATANKNIRYLFVSPEFSNKNYLPENMIEHKDQAVTLHTSYSPSKVTWLNDNSELEFNYHNNIIEINVPAAKRSASVDVIKVILDN